MAYHRLTLPATVGKMLLEVRPRDLAGNKPVDALGGLDACDKVGLS